MIIVDGYVVAQADTGVGYTSPIAQFPTLQEAADWLIAIYTRDGDDEPLPQYDPTLYVVEEWFGGEVINAWEIGPDKSATLL